VPARFIYGPNAGDYVITGGTCAGQTLAPNATCTVVVTFTAAGNVSDRTATLAAGGASMTLTGSASGFAAAWTFDAAPDGTFVISSPATNPTSASKTFTLRNTGTLAGVVPTHGLSGAHAGDYAIIGGTCAGQTLAPNATCTVQVRFSADANVSVRTATLTADGASKVLIGSASGFAPD
jgi:hypothetical protein